MKTLFFPILFVMVLFNFSCKKDSSTDSNFKKILGTYSGPATYNYHENVNNVYFEEHEEIQGSITVTEVSSSDQTFRITGTGFLSNAFDGYDSNIYTWDADKLNSGMYFAVKGKFVSGVSDRNVSTRFKLDDGTVMMDYGEQINSKTSTETIHFEGGK